MGVISAGLHRILDYVTVVAFALAPSLFGLTGAPAMLAYGLAGVHLLLTLSTRFTRGGSGFVPFRAHGFIEVVVGIALAIAPFALGWPGAARNFYLACGVIFLIVWTLTDFTERPARP